jgi:AraC-like DNA-binding protein
LQKSHQTGYHFENLHYQTIKFQNEKVETKVCVTSGNNTIQLFQIGEDETDCCFKGMGIQYIAVGNVEYVANRKKFEAFEGDYIIGNAHTSPIVKVRRKKPSEIICIDISPETICEIAEVHGIHCADFINFLLSDQFLVNRYCARNSELESLLVTIFRHVKSGKPQHQWLNQQFFHDLAKVIISDQRLIFQHLNKVNLRSVVAKNEVFRSLLRAKYFIDKEFLKTPDLDQLCESAGISRFYFCRLFKLVWGISPYQYLKHKKLELARREILSGKTIAEVGFFVGFSEVAAFSKAFKQHYGCNPRAIKKNLIFSESGVC